MANASKISQSRKVFDGSWDIFNKHWSLLLTLTAVPMVLDFALLNTVFTDVRDFLYNAEGIEDFSAFVDQLPPDFSPYIGISLILGTIIAGSYIGALIAIIRDKKTVRLGYALRYGLDSFWELFTVGLVVGLFVLVGLAALVIPGVIAAVVLMFAFHARLEQVISVSESLKESVRIVRANWKQLTFVLLGIFGIAILSDLIARLLSGSLTSTGASAVTILVSIPSSAFMAIIFTKAYFIFK